MKKGDIIIILSVFLAAVVMFLFWFLGKKSGTTVTVTKDNEVIYSVPLNEDTVLDAGTNVIIIENGKVWVKEANCKNQICVNHKPIKKTGEVIACLPNKVMVEIE